MPQRVVAVRQAASSPFPSLVRVMACSCRLGMQQLSPLSATNVGLDPYQLVVFGVLDRVADGGVEFRGAPR